MHDAHRLAHGVDDGHPPGQVPQLAGRVDLEREHPGLKRSVLKALGNVQPRHLLDRRLNPPAALRARVGAAAAAVVAG